MQHIDLDSIENNIACLTKTKAAFLREACIWCLLTCDHKNGVELEAAIVKKILPHSIIWGENEDFSKLKMSYNLDDAIEFGAEAISLLFIQQNTDYKVIQRAVKKTGIDYWLKKDDSQPLFSMGDARLEISGILKERGSNTVKKRISEKIAQARKGPKVFPVFISVVEFSKPMAKAEKFHD
ncbi:hypothetical protein MASR1M12_09830 [Erysipelotrichia bacterium]